MSCVESEDMSCVQIRYNCSVLWPPPQSVAGSIRPPAILRGFLSIGFEQSTCQDSQQNPCLTSQQGRWPGSQQGARLASQQQRPNMILTLKKDCCFKISRQTNQLYSSYTAQKSRSFCDYSANKSSMLGLHCKRICDSNVERHNNQLCQGSTGKHLATPGSSEKKQLC